jgi:chemosensory pili system protein ChpA (sensor histidine kinase/response regulator)
VVDDSITVRRVTARLLERHGMAVTTARDGVDALQKLQEQPPDLVLLDVEMPRMDVFELLANMQSSDALRAVPVVMVTSRTGDKHRERALTLGAAEYLGKPFQEADLLQTIARFTQPAESAAPTESVAP